ncbi:MAG: NAD(P)H-dependent oxidoreductase [Candidatus Heimdallarchaeota archaeon]
MNILVVFAHPNDDSFGSAIKEKIIQGLLVGDHKVQVHDLYRDGFNPILTKKELLGETKPEENFHVKKYQEDITWSQRIIVIHPVWWCNVPAMLKGYFDRVLSLNFAYETIRGKRKPLLGGRKGILVQTFDTEKTVDTKKCEDSSFKTVINVWKICGVKDWHRFTMFDVQVSKLEQREKWLKEAYVLGFMIDR